MATVNETNFREDLTVRVFDRFYSFDVNVPVDRAAGNFATSLFRIAQNTNIPAMTLLAGFQGQTGVNLTVNLAYYLNLIRSKATLLGVNASATPNFYAARAVLQ
jgi:hypothetical protein